MSALHEREIPSASMRFDTPEWAVFPFHALIVTEAGKPVFSYNSDPISMITPSATLPVLFATAQMIHKDQLVSFESDDRRTFFQKRGHLIFMITGPSHVPWCIFSRLLTLLHISLIATTSIVIYTFPGKDVRRLQFGPKSGLLSQCLQRATGLDLITPLCAVRVRAIPTDMRLKLLQIAKHIRHLCPACRIAVLLSGNQYVGAIAPPGSSNSPSLHTQDLFVIQLLSAWLQKDKQQLMSPSVTQPQTPEPEVGPDPEMPVVQFEEEDVQSGQENQDGDGSSGLDSELQLNSPRGRASPPPFAPLRPIESILTPIVLPHLNCQAKLFAHCCDLIPGLQIVQLLVEDKQETIRATVNVAQRLREKLASESALEPIRKLLLPSQPPLLPASACGQQTVRWWAFADLSDVRRRQSTSCIPSDSMGDPELYEITVRRYHAMLRQAVALFQNGAQPNDREGMPIFNELEYQKSTPSSILDSIPDIELTAQTFSRDGTVMVSSASENAILTVESMFVSFVVVDLTHPQHDALQVAASVMKWGQECQTLWAPHPLNWDSR